MTTKTTALPTVSPAIVRVLADAIEQRSAAGRRELVRLGVPERLAEGSRLPEALVTELFVRGPIVTGDPDFGLHAGERSARGTYGFVEYFVASSGTLREGLVRLVEHYRLLSESGSVVFAARAGGGRLTFSNTERALHRHEAENFVSAVLAVARRAVGGMRCHAAVGFSHARPADTREHARILGEPITFDERATFITFDDAALELPLRTADAALVDLLRPLVTAASREVAPADVITRARAAVRRSMASGDVSVRAIARAVAMSPRSLQRALAERATSVAAIVDESRRELAYELLADPRAELAEIATMLGFSRTSAFHRAFRRWSRATPAAYRRARLGSHATT